MGGRIVSVGECMVEFAPQGDGTYRQGFAGDTFNMAWYLRRLLPAAWRVDYLTALGDDPMSDRVAAFMVEAGVGTGHIARLRGRTPGLYVISLLNGERSFSYWRDRSAACELAANAGHLDLAFGGADLLVLSGITLAILPEVGRTTLLAALSAARRAGARVAFDPNVRLRLWPDAVAMRRWISAAAAGADIVLPSFEDDRQAFGDVSPTETARRYLALGAGQVVVKNGADEITWRDPAGTGRLRPPLVGDVVDSTAAGDSFNAGFLAARLTGATMPEAIAAAADVAARVVQARGALVPV
ncbi:MAG: sugar kinase [Paracoccaceae bacterium]